jgi:lipoprotein-releasing system ATP-binding protein
MNKVLEIHGLERQFKQGNEVIHVLRNVQLSLAAGEIVALLGSSGAGKSTLLQAVGLLESGFTGEIEIAGENAGGLKDEARTRFRQKHLGFVYQFHHLLPDFTALENVTLAGLIAGFKKPQAMERARVMLTDLGLGARLHHRPAALSGGEQQRVAVARALVNAPSLVLADEPTGNLDETTAHKVLGEFLRLARANGSAVLVATHNEKLAAQMDRIFRLENGVLTSG